MEGPERPARQNATGAAGKTPAPVAPAGRPAVAEDDASASGRRASGTQPVKTIDRIAPDEGMSAAGGAARQPAPLAVVDVLPHFLASGVIAGVLLALVLLLMVSLVHRPALSRVGAIVFALGALAFSLAYTGVLSALWGVQPVHLLPVAAMAEALLLLGASMWLAGWLGLPAARWARIVLMAVNGLLLSLVVLSFIYPMTLLSVARTGLFAVVLAGIGVAFWPGLAPRRNVSALLALAGLFAWSLFGLLLTLQVLVVSSPGAVLATSALVTVLALLLGMAAILPPQRRQQVDSQTAALALAGADALLFRFEPATARLWVSPRLARELHLPPEVLNTIDGFMTIVHPEDRPVLEAALRTAALDEPTALNLRLADAQGVWRHFTLRARAMRERADAPRVIVGILLETDEHAVRQVALPATAETPETAGEPLHDPLTGLPGQALLLDRLETALARARRGEGMPCLLIVDVDRFRAIIDALGIVAGDTLISELARRLASLLQEGETLARLSGDQFALVVDAERHGTPLSFVQQIREITAAPMQLDGQEVNISLSIGVVDLVAAMTLSPRELVRAAEIALFEARREGPGHEAFFTPDMHGEHARLARLEQELRRALKMGELEVHYQPIIWLGSRQLAGFEALVRWRHPQRGLIGPEEFIGLAEDIGLVRDIGHLVLREAIRQLAIWQRSFRTEHPFYVAVNVASTDLLDTTLADEVAQLLAQENANPQGLKLEVTESLLLRDPAGARTTLRKLVEMGVGVVCDDFGTGYSSLSRLRTLPFDALKIDRSFLLSDDAASRSVIAAIVELAHGLSMHVVAEGVEAPWQLLMLEELACDMAQGYLIAPALDASTILHGMSEARRIAPFSGRLEVLSHLLLSREVAPPLPPDVGKPQLPPSHLPPVPPRPQVRKEAPPSPPEASSSPPKASPAPSEMAHDTAEAEEVAKDGAGKAEKAADAGTEKEARKGDGAGKAEKTADAGTEKTAREGDGAGKAKKAADAGTEKTAREGDGDSEPESEPAADDGAADADDHSRRPAAE